jgi:hypothetical protein
LAAVMRYQAGLVLPFFALAILMTPTVANRRREALSCLLVGGAFGAALVAYNSIALGHPFGLYEGHGYFSRDVILPNLAWFGAALLVIWPLMLLAPLLDRSPVRWGARALIVPMFALASCWFFHDRNPSPAFTLVLVQRQLITILPVWIIGYACVADALVLRRMAAVLPRSLMGATIACACVAVMGVQGVIFQRHQRHLEDLRAARDEVARVVPAGSVVVGNSTMEKLFGIPIDSPAYEWMSYSYQGTAIDHSAVLQTISEPWYLALLPKEPGAELPETLTDYVSRYHMTRVSTHHPTLILYRAVPAAGRAADAGPRPQPGTAGGSDQP